MLETGYEIKPAALRFPAGLISWYAADGAPVVLVTSWVALISGDPPCMRMAWYGRYSSRSRSWAGGDFVFNVPSEPLLQVVRDLLGQGKFSMDARADLQQACLRGVSAAAPRLPDSTVQLECVGGRLLDSDYDTELRGELVHLHRGRVSMAVAEIEDLCAIQPLSPLPGD